MPIPAGAIPVTDLDATADSPASARASAILPVVQQFNALIASANGVTGMAVLDASGFLAGYGRLAAAQTWTGVNTFTAQAAILFSASSPNLRWRDTAVALPGGAYTWQCTAGLFRLLRNTAAAGDYSSSTVPMVFAANDAVTFASTVAVANAVAAGDAVNKGQLDGRIKAAEILLSAGVASFVGITPPGWTAFRSAAGKVSIGTVVTPVAVSITPFNSGGGFNYTAICSSLSGGGFGVTTKLSGTDSDVSFLVIAIMP